MATNQQPYQSAIPLCKDHTEENLNSYCFTCKFRICEKCCHDEHKTHECMGSEEAARNIREKRGEKCHKIVGMIERMISGLEQDKDEAADIERIEEIKIEYKSFIDNWAENMKTKRRDTGKKNIMIENLKTMLRLYDKEVQSERDSVALEAEEELQTLQKNLSKPIRDTENKKFKFKEGTFSPDVLVDMLGDVKEDESKVKVTEGSSSPIDLNSTHCISIVPVTRGEALVGTWNRKHIHNVDVTVGRVEKERKLPTIFEDFIMADNDIIYTHFGDKRIRRISSSGTVSDVHSTAPLHPRGITTSPDGGLLVTLCDCEAKHIAPTSRGEIIHINGDVIRKYGHRDNALINPHRVSQNVNMDLCIVDIVDKDGKARLVVLSDTSKVQFIYDGESSLKKNFEPTDVCCDRYGRIILNCLQNDIVILLSEDGRLIQHLLTAGSPHSLALQEDTLWVGCKAGTVRVYNYNEDGD